MNEKMSVNASGADHAGEACTVTVVGLGLMGASLALRLRRSRAYARVWGWARREEAVNEALDKEVIDFGSTSVEDVLPAADITVLCLPVNTIIAFGKEHAALWKPGSVVTDVGSVKQVIVNNLANLLAGYSVHFIGSHPMAGSEKAGLSNADSSLYDGARVFLTSCNRDPAAAVERVERLWRMAGAETRHLSPHSHDSMVAHTSHLVHLLAAVAVESTLADETRGDGAAGGFRDFTRIAAGNSGMWREIVENNQEQVLAALDDFQREVGTVRTLLEKGHWDELQDYLERAKARRQRWTYQKREGIEQE